ncbi:PRC-barrel domain-containing protein [Methylobacterium sp. Leaf99]|uniref:PRC-barrel domain-containing protein n=1 Tax=Methylobacterium sp. Leaf99 TaxID=1736251 RepID=UPI001FCDE73E|nr:PRC-barrel domain-containing protein [Methylobacterium sp. Leaf99]
MFRLIRMIAATTIGLGAASVLAEDAAPGARPAEAPAASAPPAAAPPAPTVQPQAGPAAAPALPPAQGGATGPAPAQNVAPAPPSAPPQGAAPSQSAAPPQGSAQPQGPVIPTGTPATVLDTADYEGVLGKAVRSATGEDMGRIIDIVLDKDGRPRAAIIDFGGFLGVGSRKIAVDWRSMRFTSDGKPTRLVLQLSRNQVRVSPEYKPGEPIVVLGPASPAVPEGDQQAAAPAAPPAAPPAVVAPTAPAVPAAEKPPEKPAERTPEK